MQRPKTLFKKTSLILALASLASCPIAFAQNSPRHATYLNCAAVITGKILNKTKNDIQSFEEATTIGLDAKNNRSKNVLWRLKNEFDLKEQQTDEPNTRIFSKTLRWKNVEFRVREITSTENRAIPKNLAMPKESSTIFNRVNGMTQYTGQLTDYFTNQPYTKTSIDIKKTVLILEMRNLRATKAKPDVSFIQVGKSTFETIMDENARINPSTENIVETQTTRYGSAIRANSSIPKDLPYLIEESLDPVAIKTALDRTHAAQEKIKSTKGYLIEDKVTLPHTNIHLTLGALKNLETFQTWLAIHGYVKLEPTASMTFQHNGTAYFAHGFLPEYLIRVQKHSNEILDFEIIKRAPNNTVLSITQYKFEAGSLKIIKGDQLIDERVLFLKTMSHLSADGSTSISRFTQKSYF